MVLNALPLTANQLYCSWYTITYFVGDFGLLVGVVLLIRLLKDSVIGFKQVIISLARFRLIVWMRLSREL